jgi:hypothetical protein
MRAELQSYHTFDSTQVACYARVSALSQRRAADASEASLHTLGLFVLALQVQDGAAPVGSGSRVLIDIVTKATVINQAVLAILIVVSIWSWAIILSKTLAYGKVQKQSSQFLEAFRPVRWSAYSRPVMPSSTRNSDSAVRIRPIHRALPLVQH